MGVGVLSQQSTFLNILFTIVYLCSKYVSSQPSASPVISQVSNTVTFSWDIPEGGLSAGSNFFAVSPGNVAVFILTSTGTFLPTDNYRDRVTFLGSRSSRNITFTMTNIQTSDAGNYSCRNGGVTDVISNCGQMLIVLMKPTTPGLPVASPTPVYNQQVTLTCSSTSTTVPADHGLSLTYSWQRDGSDVTPSPSPGSSYTLTVKSRNSQTYRCRARESQGPESEWSPVYNMVPEYGPYQISLSPSTLSYTVTEDKDTISPITCSANGRPGCNYRWFKNGTTNAGTDATLRLGQAVRAKTGSYRCQPYNKHGDDYSSTVSVNVQYLSRPLLTIDKTELMENDTVKLTCSVVSNPTVEMTIKNVDNDTVVVQRNTNTLSYTIQRVQCLHNGTFVCSADNRKAGVVYKTEAELKVLCSPRLDTRQPYIEVIRTGLDQAASFVAIVTSNPTPTFAWFRHVNDQEIPIPNSTRHTIIASDLKSVLQITVGHNRDYGGYAASVENYLGKLLILFNLSPVSPPLSPDKMTVGNKTATSVSVRWKSNDNGGSEQTFSVEYQTSGSDWRLWEEGISDLGQGTWLNTTITNLRPDTEYYVQVYSKNLYGNSGKVVREARTLSLQKQETSERLEGIGIGVAASLPIIIGLIIALVVSLRRRYPKKQDIPPTYNDLKTDGHGGNEYEQLEVPSDTTESTTVYQNESALGNTQI